MQQIEETDKIWSQALAEISQKVPEHLFNLWFKPMRLLSIKDSTAVIEIPNRFFKDWLDEFYPTVLSDVFTSILGQPLTLKFKVLVEDAKSDKQTKKIESRKVKLANKGIFLNPKYTFSSFVAGKSNEFAYSASKCVADNPGRAYNPLFIYGDTGLGKTHLMHAIGNYIADKKTNLSICYVSTEDFTSDLRSALLNNKMMEFKETYRNVDVLLIDDIQFIASKTSTQEEFFHTFNTLYEKQKQIVISSDRPPVEIADITDRLRSRFSMGLLAGIEPPDIEMKVAIIYKKAQIEKIDIPEDVAYFIASGIKSNVREIEGCLLKLGMFSCFKNIPIDLDMAKDLLKDIISTEDKIITVDVIQKAVCSVLNVKLADMKTKKRTKEIASARQIAMYLSKKLTNLSLTDIGGHFGGKDHATVIYACRQVEEKIAEDEATARLIESLIKKIKS